MLRPARTICRCPHPGSKQHQRQEFEGGISYCYATIRYIKPETQAHIATTADDTESVVIQGPPSRPTSRPGPRSFTSRFEWPSGYQRALGIDEYRERYVELTGNLADAITGKNAVPAFLGVGGVMAPIIGPCAPFGGGGGGFGLRVPVVSYAPLLILREQPLQMGLRYYISGLES